MDNSQSPGTGHSSHTQSIQTGSSPCSPGRVIHDDPASHDSTIDSDAALYKTEAINQPPMSIELARSRSGMSLSNSDHLAENGYVQSAGPSHSALLPEIERHDTLPLLNTDAFDAAYSRELSSTAATTSQHTIESDDWNAVTKDSLLPVKHRKPRRVKPRIELAPDQPPTTQGKPRARVYVACVQCRTRKIRCDGAKPVCHNCCRRSHNAECVYDAVPKRRGPDKTPGARQRLAREMRDQLDISVRPRRRRKMQEDQHCVKIKSLKSDFDTADVTPIRLHTSSSLSLNTKYTGCECGSVSEYLTKCRCHGMSSCPMMTVPGATYSPTNDFVSSHGFLGSNNALTYSIVQNGYRYLVELDEDRNEARRHDSATAINSGPSLSFTRKVWWDSLLSLYLSPNSTRLHYLTHPQRETATRGISSDLRFTFRASNYWFSFFHIPTFFSNFFDPARREVMQPCLVLALLAMATFWQSSEVGMSELGRERALRFRDEAQSALEASLSAGWIDETLAQAAWVLALFEVCAHPRHSSERSASALAMLDSLIQGLSLTLLDANDPDTSVFLPRSVPSVFDRTPWLSQTYTSSYQTSSRNLGGHATATQDMGCSCKAITLVERWHLANEHAPLWGHTPAWHTAWTEAEIRKESCRRLCWSSMVLTAGYISYTTATKTKAPEFFIADPANYALLFSAESIARSPAISSDRSSKSTIWGLYDRAFLLWHACIRIRDDPTAVDTEKAEFAMKAWLEADSLEAALNRHTCDLEKAFIFQGREYLFNTRMFISYEFQRFIPLATANVSGLFHRNKAEEWLTHQATLGRRFMSGLHTITGNSGNLLAMRPFFVFWFMGQICRALLLWQYDNSLIIALDVCKALIPAIDYLTALWPCPEQRTRYEGLRQRLDSACYVAGVSRPPPLNLALQLPLSPEALV
ncbi:hypothetical protein AX17_005191 [Amanita inopinata Kibby_2008]|nr:hypothetical protein AX17_005191 [Amanita inopinata Kibby_2008]